MATQHAIHSSATELSTNRVPMQVCEEPLAEAANATGAVSVFDESEDEPDSEEDSQAQDPEEREQLENEGHAVKAPQTTEEEVGQTSSAAASSSRTSKASSTSSNKTDKKQSRKKKPTGKRSSSRVFGKSTSKNALDTTPNEEQSSAKKQSQRKTAETEAATTTTAAATMQSPDELAGTAQADEVEFVPNQPAKSKKPTKKNRTKTKKSTTTTTTTTTTTNTDKNSSKTNDSQIDAVQQASQTAANGNEPVAENSDPQKATTNQPTKSPASREVESSAFASETTAEGGQEDQVCGVQSSDRPAGANALSLAAARSVRPASVATASSGAGDEDDGDSLGMILSPRSQTAVGLVVAAQREAAARCADMTSVQAPVLTVEDLLVVLRRQISAEVLTTEEAYLCLETVHTYLINIVRNPTATKYRSIATNNPNYRWRIQSLCGEPLLLGVGFETVAPKDGPIVLQLKIPTSEEARLNQMAFITAASKLVKRELNRLKTVRAEQLLLDCPLQGKSIHRKVVTNRAGRRFPVGFCETIGRRFSMEDQLVIQGCFRGRLDSDFYGVFDGHGGSMAADFVAKYMHTRLWKRMAINGGGQSHPQVVDALRGSFVELHQKLLEQRCTSGTTALVALILGKTLFVANAGDTRAVMCMRAKVKSSRHYRAARLSIDHKPDLPEETQRIEALGGSVTKVLGVARVNGGLAVSRAIGDAPYHPFVTPEPHVVVTEITPADKYLILACDGVWDILTDQMAANIAGRARTAGQAATALLKASYEKGSMDNITVVVVDLKHARWDGMPPPAEEKRDDSPVPLEGEGAVAGETLLPEELQAYQAAPDIDPSLHIAVHSPAELSRREHNHDEGSGRLQQQQLDERTEDTELLPSALLPLPDAEKGAASVTKSPRKNKSRSKSRGKSSRKTTASPTSSPSLSPSPTPSPSKSRSRTKRIFGSPRKKSPSDSRGDAAGGDESNDRVDSPLKLTSSSPPHSSSPPLTALNATT